MEDGKSMLVFVTVPPTWLVSRVLDKEDPKRDELNREGLLELVSGALLSKFDLRLGFRELEVVSVEC